jgi:hypothetical protein
MDNRAAMVTWQDQLSDEVRELEANGVDVAAGDRARAMLKSVRGFEVRLRQLSLRIADASPTSSKPARHTVERERKPLYRTFDADLGRYLDDPLGVGKK